MTPTKATQKPFAELAMDCIRPLDEAGQLTRQEFRKFCIFQILGTMNKVGIQMPRGPRRYSYLNEF